MYLQPTQLMYTLQKGSVIFYDIKIEITFETDITMTIEFFSVALFIIYLTRRCIVASTFASIAVP
jgi:hypothetical protein